MWIPWYLFLRLLLCFGRRGHALAYNLVTRWTFNRRASLRRAAKVIFILDDMPSCPRCGMLVWPKTLRCPHCDLKDDLGLKSKPRRRLDIWFSPN